MKIDTVTTGAVTPKKSTNLMKTGRQGKTADTRRDTVEFSSELSRLRRAMAQIPEDTSRVDELKGAISSGTYTVSGTAVAEKMLQSGSL